MSITFGASSGNYSTYNTFANQVASNKIPVKKAFQAVDVLADLEGMQLNGISFPYINLTTTISHHLANHEYAGVDVGRKENTGRKATTFSFTALFYDIKKGKNESWQLHTLYNQVYKQITELCLLSLGKSTLTFTHPVYGNISVKCVSCRDVLDAHKRGGAELHIELVETIGDLYNLDINSNSNGFATMTTNANNLDKSLTKLSNVPGIPNSITIGSYFGKLAGTLQAYANYPGNVISTFESQVNQITNAVNATNNLVQSIPSIINNDVARVNQMLAKVNTMVDQCKNLLIVLYNVNNNIIADSINNTYLLFSSLLTIQKTLMVPPSVSGGGNSVSNITTYTTQDKMNICLLAQTLGVDFSLLIAMNPSLVLTPMIPVGTTISYAK